jgi:hypothetical protein
MLLFIDSFDHLTTADLGQKWLTPGTGNLITTGGRRGSLCYALSPAFPGQQAIAFSGTTCVLGFAVKFPSITTFGQFCGVRDALNSQDQVAVRLNADGSLSVGVPSSSTVLGALGTVFGTTAPGVILSNTFYYIELKVVLHASAGTVEVRVNGSARLGPFTGLNTAISGTAQANRIAIQGVSPGNTHFDDLYVCDGSGSSNTSFLGECRVDVHWPNGAGATAGWTPSAGSNYQCVDDATPNGDTDYVSTSTLNALDTYALEDFKVPGGTIQGVQVNLSARATSLGTAQIAAALRQSSTDYAATAQGLTDEYLVRWQAYDVNPATSAAFTEAEFNAIQAGVKKIA